jgi:hypothetical protein
MRFFPVEWNLLPNSAHKSASLLYQFLVLTDLSVHDYCCKLKRLADTLTDVGHPITDQDLVVNALRGLNKKFTNALGVINTMNPLPSFLWVHFYLVQDEMRLNRSHKMAAVNSLLGVGTPAGISTGATSGASTATLVASGTPVGTSKLSGFSPTKGGDRPKKRKQSNNKPRDNSGSSPGFSASPQ